MCADRDGSSASEAEPARVLCTRSGTSVAKPLAVVAAHVDAIARNRQTDRCRALLAPTALPSRLPGHRAYQRPTIGARIVPAGPSLFHAAGVDAAVGPLLQR